jgi:small subunit ribosomal protein S6
MPLYESTFIARQDLSKQDVTRLTSLFSDIATKEGAKVVKTEYWGLRNLTYKIKKNRKGHYTMLALDAPSSAVKEMERNMRINEEVIRSLTVRVEEISEEPSPILNTRNSRDDVPGADAEIVAQD